MKKEVSAGVLVYRWDATTQSASSAQREPVYLVLHYISGHWDFAKGKLEGQETKREAALRELREETGLSAELDKEFESSLSYYFRNRRGELVDKEVTFFLGQGSSPEVSLSREHIYYRWLPFTEALQQLTYENAKQVLRQAHQIISKAA